jgi:hypothetical protein
MKYYEGLAAFVGRESTINLTKGDIMSYEWLDKYIEEQKTQTIIIKAICYPTDPADLQETAEKENWETE